MSMPVRASFVFESAAVAYVSTDGLIEAGNLGNGGASCNPKTSGSEDFVVSTTCLLLSVRILRAVGMRGGCTGASGRGGMFVRGATGGGGRELAGCPSASRNLRMRASSDSIGARLGSSPNCGLVVDLCSGFCSFFFVSPALLASNLNNAAITISKMKRRLSRCMFRRR